MFGGNENSLSQGSSSDQKQGDFETKQKMPRFERESKLLKDIYTYNNM